MPLDVQGTDYIKLPVGTTSQRPLVPTVGMLRFNIDLFKYEYYNGFAWVLL